MEVKILKIDYEKVLNKSQYIAIKELENFIRVVGAPGVGKTRVLVHKIHYMIEECKIKPENILVATFTKKAADEMKERLYKFFDKEDLMNLSIGTFHSFGYKILKHEYMLLEDPMADFKLLEGPPIKWLLKEILNELNITTTDKYNESTFEREISKLKMELISPECLLMNFLLEAPTKEQKDLIRVYEQYEQKKKEKKVIDYNDMLYQLYNLFIQYPLILEKYQNRFQYILVDEAQDNAHHQYELIKMLMAKHNNVFIIGDIDQSIFGFRGAKPEKFINFNDNENVINLNLEDNYRSLPFITTAANNLIQHNKIRLDKKIIPFRIGEGNIILNNYGNEEVEAQNISQRVQDLIEEGFSYKDIIILFRINAQSRAIEDQMVQNSIPYISNGLSFYERTEIKDIISYLKLVHNTLDNEAFSRIYNKPSRYLGKVFIESIERESQKRRISYYEALEYVDAPFKNKPAVIKFKREIKDIKEEIKKNKNVGEIIQFIRNTINYDSYMMKENLDNEDNTKIDNLNALVNHASKYNDINEFLKFVNKFQNNKVEDGVKLSTIHQAKGLEYPVVFLVGTSDGILPHAYSLNSLEENAVEEERRLMYVAMTRAKDKLYISSINNFQGKKLNPSMFLEEI